MFLVVGVNVLLLQMVEYFSEIVIVSITISHFRRKTLI